MRCAPSTGGKQRNYFQSKSRNLLPERDRINVDNCLCDQNSTHNFLSAQILEEPIEPFKSQSF